MKEEDADAYVKEFESKREFLKDFSLQLKSTIQNILDAEELKYFAVECRIKAPESLRQKLIDSTKEIKGLEDVQDLVGVRIITYVSSDIEKMRKMLRGNFDIQEEEGVEQRLGINMVGYRAHHMAIRLPPQRLQLPEYRKFEGVIAELQICTILQHAWAQIEHDQIYKPTSVLPDSIKRSFSLLAGTLELADNEFNRISNEIGAYQSAVDEQTKKGELDIRIDSISLRKFFDTKFKSWKNVRPIFGPADDITEKIISELNLMGITTLRELDAIIPKDYKTVLEAQNEHKNYAGIARSLMLVHDAEKYISKAWRNGWHSISESTLGIIRHYHVDEKHIQPVMKE